MLTSLLRVLTVTILVVAPTMWAAAQQAAPVRVTAASNVRVRAAPSVEVKIVATLPLGTDLVELETSPDAQWVRVRTPQGVEGWISSNLTRRVTASDRTRVLEDIVARRAEQGGFGFQAAVELVALIERQQATVKEPEAAARLALYRLRAVNDAARSGSMRYRPTPGPVAEWYAAKSALLVFSEPAATWRLKREAILAEHDRHRGTTAAEQMAWLAVTNDLPGECEGDVPCYANRENLLPAEYLRRYPAGTFVGAALRRILDQATYWQPLMADPRMFTTADCDRLKPPLASLRAAVAAAMLTSDATVQARTLKELDAVGQVCRVFM